MAIEITDFADVSISVSPTGVSGGNFGILGFLTKSSDTATRAIPPAERARSYTTLASVGADWPATSEVYKSATAFYGQTPTPRDFVVLMQYVTAQPASLSGGNSDTLEEFLDPGSWNTSGVFNVTVDGTVVAITDLDISSANTMAGVAQELEDAITAEAAGALVAVEWTGINFVMTSLVTGVASTITAASGNAAESFGFAAFQAQVSNGVAVETPVDALAAAETAGVEWVATDLHKELRDETGAAEGENTLEIAQWCEAAKKIFLNTTNDLNTLSTSGSADTASQLKAATLRFSLSTFSQSLNQYPSSSVFGRAASVNFSAIGTTITMNLKQMPGVTAENLNPSQFAALRSKYCSAVVQIGKSVNAYSDSRMASGSWLDTTHGLMWLENRCETDLFNLLYVQNTKVPYTQTGINIVAARLEQSLLAAVRNGLAGPGYLSDGTFLPEGFRVDAVPLADVPVGDIGTRLYAGLSFVMKGAGALHEVQVAGSFSE